MVFDFFAAFNTIFFGIILQAFPFVLLGILVSSALSVFVSDEFIVKIFPTRWGLGFITALFSGLLFPVCECATVPVMNRLIKKGVAMPIAVTFMLAAPIVNPISIFATFYAFSSVPKVAFFRIYFGLTTALVIGLFLLFYPKEKVKKEDDKMKSSSENKMRYAATSKSQSKIVNFKNPNISKNKTFGQKLNAMFLHVGSEFFSAGKFLILGAMFAAMVRVAIPESILNRQSGEGLVGILIQMLFAFLFSACSTSDAFIARSFLGRFSLSSIMGFLVYGPMMDVKNFFMLLSFFKKQFVVELAIIVTIVNIIMISVLTTIFM